MERTITALKAQKRNPNRINVYLDGSYAFAVARIVGAWLYVGLALTEEKVATLQEQDTQEVAYQRALRFAGYRARSETEVRRKLDDLGFSEQVIEETVLRLREERALGDEKFAQDWVESRSTFRPRSHRVMAMELRQKGVAEEFIQKALDEAVDEDKLAYQAALTRARRWADLDFAAFRERLGAYLMRRGFSYGTISGLVHRVWTDLQSSTQDGSTNQKPWTDEENNG